MDNETARIHEMVRRLKVAGEKWEKTTLSLYFDQPFKALIAGMLSARTREEDTLHAMNALFALADNPHDMARLPYETLLKAVARVTFPETKARNIPLICQRLVANNGEVPPTIEELTEYEGVGWKVAVLTQQIAYRIAEQLCVDVHVGRIGVRLGLVKPTTTQPQKIARELEAVIPQEYWIDWNQMMVVFGRNMCYPTRPACPRCPLKDLCPKVGV